MYIIFTSMNSHHIKLDDETERFLQEYKKSHGVKLQAFVELAVKEKIINIKTEIKLNDYVNNK